MKLIVISNSSAFDNEAKIVNRLFEAGLQLFHLRKSSCTRRYCEQIINEIDKAYHHRIALHQFHDLAEDFGINRLHFPETLREQNQVGKNMPGAKDLILSTSIHDLQNLDDLNGFEYTFFGPVFNSISKPGYRGMSATDFKLPADKGNPEVIALGGIDAGKVGQINAMQFDGLAVLGAIWNNPSKALHNFKKIQKNVNRQAICN